MINVEQLLKDVAFDSRISDLHLTVNSTPIIRMNGDLQPFTKHNEILAYQNIVEIAKYLMNEEQYQVFEEKGEYDFPIVCQLLAVFGLMYTVNVVQSVWLCG